MPKVELEMVDDPARLHAAARDQEQVRVRVRGTVVDRGYGHSGRYATAWLRVLTPAGSVRITASPSSILGTLAVGSEVGVALELTGLVDVADGDLYYACKTRLLAWQPLAHAV
jgi:hypothetical protein